MASIALRRSGSFSSADDSTSDNGSNSGGGGGPPKRTNMYGFHGHASGPTLTSLDYNPDSSPLRRHSLMENQRLSQSSGLGDDLSLVGEYDNNSVRSDKMRPGRRASLSAAIELTMSPPAKPRSSGRRNSLFGNNGGKDKDAKNAEAKAASKAKSSRRASMAGAPPSTELVSSEPAATPAFFHSRKKDKSRPAPPDRRKTKSFDRADTRAEKTSARPGQQKIKRPGKGGSRRASMSSAIPRRFSMSKSSSKGSKQGSNRSILSNSNSQSNSASSDSFGDISDDDVENYSHSSGGGGPSYSSRTKTAPPLKSYGKRGSKKDKEKIEEDLGYSDHNTYDPQLPPPPAPPVRTSSSVKRAFQNRRGSTGMAAGFSSTTAAQRSLKESLQWKAGQEQAGISIISSTHANRRSSAASSVANSVATDVASNVQRGPADVPPTRRVPADVPPPPSGGRRGPSDVPPGRGPSDVPPGRRGPSDVPPSAANRALGDMDSSTSSFSMDSDLNNSTHIPANRKSMHSSQLSGAGLSTYGNASSRTGNTSAVGSLMDDFSDGSHGDGMGGLAITSSNQATAAQNKSRRTSQGLSVLRAGPTTAAGARRASLLAPGAAGVNPYGRPDSDNDDDEADEEEDEKGGKNEDKQGKVGPENSLECKTFSSDNGGSPTKRSTAETAATSTVTIADFGSVDFSKQKDIKKDDGSDGSMTSEVPNENENDNLKDVEATGDWSKKIADAREAGDWSQGVKDARDIGDWSQGVKDDILRPNKSKNSDHNSLLDRYPGSEADYGGESYGYSHLQSKDGILDAYDDESERKDGDPDYELPDLYDEDYSSLGWREHRPRAAESIEFINMEQLMSKAKNTKGLHLPTFTPAHGCTNASDFIVRCFVARLRAGMTITKHSRSRFCKSHDRILHILPTGYHVTWIPDTEEEVAAKVKKPPTKLDLTKCLEVRHAWSRDPKSIKYTGTATLRSKCKDGAANRSFALIYPHRTVDFTAMTVDQCKILMEGFSALCFRLQMARLEQQAADDSTHHTGMSGVEHDNDSTTASLTATNMSAPWGL